MRAVMAWFTLGHGSAGKIAGNCATNMFPRVPCGTVASIKLSTRGSAATARPGGPILSLLPRETASPALPRPLQAASHLPARTRLLLCPVSPPGATAGRQSFLPSSPSGRSPDLARPCLPSFPPGPTAGCHAVHRPAQRICGPREGGGGSHCGGGSAGPFPGSCPLLLPCSCPLLFLGLPTFVSGALLGWERGWLVGVFRAPAGLGPCSTLCCAARVP